MKNIYSSFICIFFYSVSLAQNVGIGEPAPAQKLDVNGNVRIQGNQLYGGASGSFNIFSNGGFRIDLDDDGGGSETFRIANGSNTLVFEVTEAGNVDADGNADFNGNLNLSGTSRTISSGDALDITSTSGMDIIIDSDNSGPGSEFYVKRDGTSGTNLFRVDEQGDATVYNKLKLTPLATAPTGAKGDMYMDNSTNKLYYHDGTAWREVVQTGSVPETDPQVGTTLSTFYVPTWSGTALENSGTIYASGSQTRIDAGDFYIGATAAASNLLYLSSFLVDWDDISYYVDPNSTSVLNEVHGDAGSATDPSFTFRSDENTGMFSPVADNIAFTTAGSERMRINNSGLVTINALGTGYTKSTSGVLSTSATVPWSDVSGAPAFLTSYTETDPQVGSNTTSYIPRWDGSALVSGVIQDNSTNVGISVAPDANVKLNVAGRIAMNDNDIRFRGPADPNHLVGHRSTFAARAMDGPLVMGHQNGALGTNNGGDRIALFWDNAGVVDIPTTLKIGSSNGIIRRTSTGSYGGANTINFGSTGLMMEDSDGDGGGFHISANGSSLWNSSDDGFVFRVYDEDVGFTTPRFIIDSDGDVGIGLASPGAKLQVEGNARFLNEIRFGNNSTTKGLVWGDVSPTWTNFYSRVDDYGGNLYLMTDDNFYVTDINTGAGTPSTTRFQINTDNGVVTIPGLGGGGTRMVTADNSGNLSVQSIPIGGDNLGNHSATTTLSMNNYTISNANDVNADRYMIDHGSGQVLEVGDDAWIADGNQANTAFVYGQQNSGLGLVRYASSGFAATGYNNSGLNASAAGNTFDGTNGVLVERTTGESAGMFGGDNWLDFWAADGIARFRDEDNINTIVATIAESGTIFQASDKRLKQNIAPLQNGLDKILMLKGYTYEYKLDSVEVVKGDTPAKSVGFLSQEVREIMPELVEDIEGTLLMNYDGITPILVEAVKEQQLMIEELKKEIEILKSQKDKE